MADDVRIEHEETGSKGRYVAHVAGSEEVAELTYSRVSAMLVIVDHTGVPDSLRGRGLGAKLAERVVIEARQHGFRIIPLCPFFKAQAPSGLGRRCSRMSDMRFLGERPIRQTVAAFLLAILVASPQALAERRTEWTFAGRVLPRQTVEVANRINGVVHSIHVVSGQRVGQGDLLVSLDDADARIDLKVAEAELAEARARLDLANDLARRQRELASRGTAPEARAVERSLEAAIAAAVVSRAAARLRLARLALSRTEVRAPIDGTVGRLKVATGAFVEAEGGTVLLELVQLDPALVAYSVPYADRMDAMAAAGAASVAGLLARLQLTLRLPNGRNHPHAGRALFESSRIDPATQALTVWGAFPNADRTLLPGLAVQVVSRFAAGSQAGEKR